MNSVTRFTRALILLSVFVSTLFAGSAFAASGITASAERYTDAKGNELATVSVEFRNIPAEYEGWQATSVESRAVCGVVTNGVVSCEFNHEDSVKGIWLYLYKKGTDQVASFYVSFFVPGQQKGEEEEPVEEPVECENLLFFMDQPLFVDPCFPM